MNESTTATEKTSTQTTVARSTAVMSAATTLSRVTGFVRTWATALALGASAAASAYTTANNVPNMIFELVAGGVLSSLFIPTFMDVQKRRGQQAAWAFACHIMTICLVALGVVAIVGTILPQPFMWTQYFLGGRAGAATDEVRQLANFFFRFFALQVIFYGVGMVMQALLNARRQYLWTSLGPVFNNLVVIGFMLVAARLPLTDGTYRLLALGTTAGVAVMFAVMVPSLARTGFRWKFELGLRDPDVRAMLRLAVPTVVYVVTNLVAVSIRNAAAGAISAGAQAQVAYANIWSNLPYGILAVSVATATFTELSDAATSRDHSGFKRSFVSGLRTTVILMLPASALLFSLARPLIALYVGGRMSTADAAPITHILQVWAVTLVFYAGMMYVIRSFYSLKDTRTVAISNLWCTLVQVAGYLFLTGSVIAAAPVFGVAGIPAADGIFYVAQFVVLLLFLRRRIGSFDLRGLIACFVRMAVISVVVGAVVWFLVAWLTPVFGSGRAAALGVVVVAGIVGLALTIAAGYLFGISEVTGLLNRLVVRLRRRGQSV
ncbi:MAG: murein biosynthesis integral membrane protein MurJ [Actinomycetes bacterium]|jgi:putative peptidoglycan lipid II flippase|nr:murein biosynthesis integral membrane protein MurJ [Actinomycetes bacterium]